MNNLKEEYDQNTNFKDLLIKNNELLKDKKTSLPEDKFKKAKTLLVQAQIYFSKNNIEKTISTLNAFDDIIIQSNRPELNKATPKKSSPKGQNAPPLITPQGKINSDTKHPSLSTLGIDLSKVNSDDDFYDVILDYEQSILPELEKTNNQEILDLKIKFDAELNNLNNMLSNEKKHPLVVNKTKNNIISILTQLKSKGISPPELKDVFKLNKLSPKETQIQEIKGLIPGINGAVKHALEQNEKIENPTEKEENKKQITRFNDAVKKLESSINIKSDDEKLQKIKKELKEISLFVRNATGGIIDIVKPKSSTNQDKTPISSNDNSNVDVVQQPKELTSSDWSKLAGEIEDLENYGGEPSLKDDDLFESQSIKNKIKSLFID